MATTRLNVSERHIARCRVILSVAAFVTIFIDPTRPTLTRWLPMTGGPLTLDRYALAVLLAHVVYSAAVYVAAARGLASAERIGKLAGDIPGYHTSPVEAAEIARDAHVQHLVFTHMVPAPNNFFLRREFLSGVSDVYSGQVTIGEDGMRFTLPPKS